MPGAAESAGTRKIGPRVLSFLVQPGTTAPKILTNCRKALDPAATPFVLGEDGTPNPFLLVQGWYRFQITAQIANLRVYVAQVPPSLVSTVQPFVRGQILDYQFSPIFNFYVDDSLIDGALVVFQCSGSVSVPTCGGQVPSFEIPLATVSRLETVLLMSETGDTTSPEQKRPSPSPLNSCGPLAKPTTP